MEPAISDNGYSLIISEDKMLAALEALAPIELNETEVLRYLEQETKIVCVDKKAVHSFLDQCSEGEGEINVTVAQGVDAKDGKDGEIIWAVDLEKDDAHSENERVDWYEQGRMISIDKDELVATVMPPLKGTDGRDIFGNVVVSKEGKPVSLSPGANVSVSDDGSKYRSTAAGMVVIKGKSVKVDPVYKVSNVDFDTGSISFNGQVIVSGSVLDLFKVKAAGDITVKGCVEGATLISKANIAIKGGVAGKDKCTIVVDGELAAHYLNYCTVKCKTNVIVDLEVMHSKVEVGDSLTVKQKGIIGGRAVVRNRLESKTLGSESETKTEIVVGEDPSKTSRLNLLRMKHRTLSARTKELTSKVAILERMKNSLPPEKRELLTELFYESEDKKAELEQINAELRLLHDEVREIQKGASLFIKDAIYPGVIIEIGGVRRELHEVLEGPVEVKFDLAKKRLLFLNTRETGRA